MSKKVIAIVLALVLSFSIVAVPASAASVEIPAVIENTFYSILDKLVSYVLSYLNKYWPGYDGGWSNADEYVAKYFYSGEDSFNRNVEDGAKWSLGYSGASLLDGLDIMNGEYFMAGSLEAVAGRVPTEVLDDQRVRVFALNDGTSGTMLYAVIDGFGLSRGDVEIIRERIDDFAKANNIISVDVSVLHQHSCIDTLGMNVPLAQALILNTGNAAVGGILDDYKVTKNKVFMNNLFDKTVQCMKDAFANMKEGTLNYGSADISEYIRDKREPSSYDGEIHRLRFTPDDGSKETWILEAGIHPISFGAGGTILTADFPYYIEKQINANDNANVVYINGAELAISKDNTLINLPEGSTALENCEAYANAIVTKVEAITDSPLDPVLNIKHQEVAVDVDNGILTLAAREDLLNAIIVKDGDGAKMITEIGYIELGNNVGIFVCPGEFEPAIIFGGAIKAEDSWNGTSWDFAPLKDFTSCENIMVFGLCNDQAGYVLTDNDYRSLFTENEEINVIGQTVGSTLTSAYIDLLASVDA